MRYRLTQLKWQLSLSALVTALLAACMLNASKTGIDLASLDRSTFITSLGAVTSILALFCSISIAFALFISQANRGERISAYDALKARLLETQQWLFTQPPSEDRETCLSLVFELDKFDITDLPQTNLANKDEYRQYAAALEAGLDDKTEGRRVFFLTSVMYFGYIEHLLNRIGLIAISQIITHNFIDTLAKGIGVICVAVATLLVATVWYSEATKQWLVLVSTFCGVASIFLFYEVCLAIYRNDKEGLDFIDRSSDEEES